MEGPGGLEQFSVLAHGKHAAQPVAENRGIFHDDDGALFDFQDPLGGKIPKDVFDIPGVAYAAGYGKPQPGEHPVMLFHMMQNGVDFRKEELFPPVGSQGDDARQDGRKVGENDGHKRTPLQKCPAGPDADSVSCREYVPIDTVSRARVPVEVRL